MTIAMSEQVDAEPCDVLRGGDGPVYFLLGGQLYVVHEVLGRWIEADQEAKRPVFENTAFESTAFEPPVFESSVSGATESDAHSDPDSNSGPDSNGGRNGGAGAGPAVPRPAAESGSPGEPRMADPPMVEHWLVTASVGRFGHPAVFRLQRRPAPPAKGPDTWTVRAERR